MKNKNFVAVIGDIVESKKDINRSDTQNKLKKVLASINSNYDDDLASYFVIDRGDELQGLVKNPAKLIKIINLIEMEMMPLSLRFGIGVGEIRTEINKNNTLEIDGPAYHRARAMIEMIQESEKEYSSNTRTLMFSNAIREKLGEEELINTIFYLTSSIKSKWTPSQKEIIYVYHCLGYNQYKTADKLNIKQSTVSRALKYANYYSYKEAMETLERYFASIYEG